MNIANNKDFKKILKKLYVISQNFLLQGKMYNLLTKSYYCVMENTTVNPVNAVKTPLWQSNVSNLLNDSLHGRLHADLGSIYLINNLNSIPFTLEHSKL